MYKTRREVFDAIVSLEVQAGAIDSVLQSEGEQEVKAIKPGIVMLRGIAQNACQVCEGELQEWCSRVDFVVSRYKRKSEKYELAKPIIDKFIGEIEEVKEKVVDYYQNRQEVEEDLFQ
ncbi:hypothetical protein ACQUY5_30270 [Bacillus cereus]|uniref:hypothetical protein n=1 Tax=Bacillus cereus TaxID=1396 RepID=UPI003D17CCCA